MVLLGLSGFLLLGEGDGSGALLNLRVGFFYVEVERGFSGQADETC